jgi:hypothetical protein
MPRIKQWLEGVRRHLPGNGARAAETEPRADPPKNGTKHAARHAPKPAATRDVEITRAVFPDKKSLR